MAEGTSPSQGTAFFVNEFAVLLISRGALDAALGANRPAMPLRLVDQPAKAVVVVLLAHLLVVEEQLACRPSEEGKAGCIVRETCGKSASGSHVAYFA